MISAWWLIPAFIGGIMFVLTGAINRFSGLIEGIWTAGLVTFILLKEKIHPTPGASKMSWRALYGAIMCSRSFW
jgi:hypothetical protein